MGILEALTLLFIALKLMGTIDWSWVAVLSPLIIAISLYLLVLFIYLIVYTRTKKRK